LISGSDWRFYELDWEIRAISLPEDNEERSKENYDGNCCYYFECGNNVLFYNLDMWKNWREEEEIKQFY
jgi:hypothetical protein